MLILTLQHNNLTSLAQIILFTSIYIDHFRQLSNHVSLTLFAHAYIVIIMQSFPSLLIALREQAVARSFKIALQGMF